MNPDVTFELEGEVEGGLYRADSEPGADEAYGGPTKVGPMSRARIAQMMMAAEKGERERIHGSTRYSSGIVASAKPDATPAEDVAIPNLADNEADSISFEPTVLVPTSVERQSTAPRHVDPETTAPAAERLQPVRMIEIRPAHMQYSTAAITYPVPAWAHAPRARNADLQLAVQISLGVFAFLAAAIPSLYFLFRM